MPSGSVKVANARPPHERVLDKIIAGPNGCWIYGGHRNREGYGRVCVGSRRDGTRRLKSTHVVMFEEFVGSVPDGMELDHQCRNKGCCRPDHLEPVTHRENTRRGMEHLSAAERERRRRHAAWMRQRRRELGQI